MLFVLVEVEAEAVALIRQIQELRFELTVVKAAVVDFTGFKVFCQSFLIRVRSLLVRREQLEQNKQIRLTLVSLLMVVTDIIRHLTRISVRPQVVRAENELKLYLQLLIPWRMVVTVE